MGGESASGAFGWGADRREPGRDVRAGSAGELDGVGRAVRAAEGELAELSVPASAVLGGQARARARGEPSRRRGTVHPLLGQRLATAGQEVIFEARWSATEPAYLGDHRVEEVALFPASGFAELALAAGAAVGSGEALSVEDLTLEQALPVPEHAFVTIQTVLTHESAGTYRFQVFSRVEAAETVEDVRWLRHASGRVCRSLESRVPERAVLASWQDACREEIPSDAHYDRCRALGLQYGPSFRAITRLWRGQNEAVAEVTLPDVARESAGSYRLDPVLLDASFQTVAAAVGELPVEDGTVWLPTGWSRLDWFASSSGPAWCHVTVRTPDPSDPPDRRSPISPIGRINPKYPPGPP